MAIELISKIKPKNGGSFALVDAVDVEMPDGTRLSEAEFGGGALIVTIDETTGLASHSASEIMGAVSAVLLINGSLYHLEHISENDAVFVRNNVAIDDLGSDSWFVYNDKTTLYVHEDGGAYIQKLIDESGSSVELDIFPEQALEFSAVSDSLYMWQTEGYHRQLSAGDTYKVAWGGEEYRCEAFEAALNGVSAVGIGNAAIAGLGEDTGEPFLFGVFTDGSATGLYTTSGEASRTVRVYQLLYPAMLPATADVHEGKIPQVVDGQIVYTDPAQMKVGEVTLETYIGNAVNRYIEEALGGEY